MRVIFLLSMVFAAAVVALVKMLPCWAVVALLVALALVARALVRWGLPRLLRLPFSAKGAVLRDAAVEVHAIEHVLVRSPSPNGMAGGEPREHFQLEVTI